LELIKQGLKLDLFKKIINDIKLEDIVGGIKVILYSIIPVEVVFRSDNYLEEYNFIEVEYEGERIEVIQLQDNTYKVNRLISTSPKMYLNPKLMPGSIIEIGL
jgi:hypothetical protein